MCERNQSEVVISSYMRHVVSGKMKNGRKRAKKELHKKLSRQMGKLLLGSSTKAFFDECIFNMHTTQRLVESESEKQQATIEGSQPT
jgi:hypothetical protein